MEQLDGDKGSVPFDSSALMDQWTDDAAFSAAVTQWCVQVAGATGAVIWRLSYTGNNTRMVRLAEAGQTITTEPRPAPHESSYRERDIHFQTLLLDGRSALMLGYTAKQPLLAVLPLLSLVSRSHRTRLEAQSSESKLQLLNEMTKITAAGLPLEKLTKTLAREIAFRFGADAALTFLVNEDRTILELRGSYGIAPRRSATEIAVTGTQLGRAFLVGGMMSFPDLTGRTDQELELFTSAGLTSVHSCCLETRGETIGQIVLGFRRPTLIEEADAALFEEFARSGAVALSTARAHARLSTYAEKLEELVEQRTSDLAVQTERAEEASKAKSRFVANMSHELRTPLTAIVGYSTVLAEGSFGPISDPQKEALLAITKSADHLKELINEVLDISKIEAGKEEPKPIQVDASSLLLQSYKLLLQTAMTKGVKLHTPQLPTNEELKPLWVDPRHVRQILINILSNAVKYTPSGGDVTITAEASGDKLRFAVTDTGVGITPEQQRTLFEEYTRGDDSYSQSQVGTGLGLSLTRHLVEINGGRIGVESEVGKGSTFWVLLPVAEAQALVQQGDTESDSGMKERVRIDGLTILVLDDSISTCEVLDAVLRSAGGNPVIAHSVAEAKVLLDEEQIDAALVDLALPTEPGIKFIEHCRKKGSAAIPLIVVSACVFEADRKEAFDAGAQAYITKPFYPEEVIGAIRRLTTAAAVEHGTMGRA